MSLANATELEAKHPEIPRAAHHAIVDLGGFEERSGGIEVDFDPPLSRLRDVRDPWRQLPGHLEVCSRRYAGETEVDGFVLRAHLRRKAGREQNADHDK